MRSLAGWRADPHVVLAAGAAVVVALEGCYRTWISDAWLLLEAMVAGAMLLYAWRAQANLRLGPLLGIAFGFHLAWISLHLGLVEVTADKDSSVVYRLQGNMLLEGDYPRSEYPVGAVLLFALEALVGDGTTRVPNALLMIPFQLAIVAAVWATRTRLSAWLAAFVALWPMNAYYWEFKFDLVPAALLAVGLVLALHERWGWSGAALGLGAAVKWVPGLAFVVLVVWLVASGRRRAAQAHALAFGLIVVTLHVPFLVWSPSEVLAAYERQSGRTITPESVWYLLVRPFGLAHVRGHISLPAGAPEWANVGATAIQGLLVLAVLIAAVRMRADRRAAVAIAAAAPAVFLLTNRIFSPQFIVVIFAALAVAAALLVQSPRGQLAVGVALAAASLGNAFVFPFALPWYDVTWPLCSAALFAFALGTTAWILRRALHARRMAAWGPRAGDAAAS